MRACEKGAIKLGDGITVDEAICDKCGKCAESCVVAHYFDKLAGDLSEPVPKKSRKKG